jgi:predicted metalloprotease with PDZ domain
MRPGALCSPKSITTRLILLLFCATLCVGAGPWPAQALWAQSQASISYTVSLVDAQNSLLRIRMTLPPGEAERQIQLPVWNALYQVRDFAQYVRKVNARNRSGNSLQVRKKDKTTWRIYGAADGTDIEYETVAILPGPYGAQFTPEHAFLNLAMVLMYEVGGRASPATVAFHGLPAGWRVATALRPAPPSQGEVTNPAFAADNYDALVDAPVEIGNFQATSFIQDGATYRIVVHGERSDFNMDQVSEMVRKITAAAVEWMEDRPFDAYTFIYHFPRAAAGGGMEHANSCAIDVTASTLASNSMALPGVTAHEFFHLWNVKRIRPQSLEPIDYTRENYTTSLWFSEGVTSTVEDYILLGAGLLDEQGFLQRLAHQIRTLQQRPAHLSQSSEESSLDTWFDKYPQYRLPQRSISYYNKGAILGVLLDLRMREASGGTKSLRDLFHWMNQQYAKQGKLFSDSDGVRLAAEGLSGADFAPFFRAYVAGVDEIPYDEFFAPVGLKLVRRTVPVTSAGFTAMRNFDTPLTVSTVEPGSAAERAGLAVGDRIVSINGEPAPADLESVIAVLEPTGVLRLRIGGRAGERDLKLKLTSKEQEDYALVDVDNITPQQHARRAAWLGSPHRPGPALPARKTSTGVLAR